MSETHAFAAASTAFVRHEMQEAEPPPITEAGAIKWLRENLFPTWLNAILTVVSVFAIYWVLAHVLPWMLSGIWDASSLTECRAVRDELGYTSAACWAVIAERWPQLIFGFYPGELYWRPILAFVLLAVAVAPILFFDLPRKMLWFSAAYPFLAFFLLWGGSVWAPITVAAGFGVAYLLYKAVLPVAGNLLATLAAIIGPIVWWLVLTGPIVGWLTSVAPLGLQYIESKQFGGFMLAVVIGLSGIVLSMPLGILLALGRQSNLFIINKISVTFIEVIRGVPLIVWLFTASLLLNYFLPPGTNFDLMLRVIIMVTLFSAAYIAEVVRGGLAALPKGQYEAADALGLDYWKAMRLIILPQALKISIPGIVNTFIGLFKDTTLVVFIGLLDPVGLSNAIRASTEWNGIYWELFIFIGIMFFCFCFFMSRYSQYLERKLRTDHR